LHIYTPAFTLAAKWKDIGQYIQLIHICALLQTRRKEGLSHKMEELGKTNCLSENVGKK
jgi:hypothetical protein